MLALSVVVGAVGIFGMYRMNEGDDQLYEGNYLPTVMAGDLSQDIVETRTFMRQFVIYDAEEEAFKNAEASIAESLASIEALMLEYEPTITEPDDRAAFDELKRYTARSGFPSSNPSSSSALRTIRIRRRKY